MFSVLYYSALFLFCPLFFGPLNFLPFVFGSLFFLPFDFRPIDLTPTYSHLVRNAWFYYVFWEFSIINNCHPYIKCCILKKLTPIVSLINTHIMLCRRAKCDCISPSNFHNCVSLDTIIACFPAIHNHVLLLSEENIKHL